MKGTYRGRGKQSRPSLFIKGNILKGRERNEMIGGVAKWRKGKMQRERQKRGNILEDKEGQMEKVTHRRGYLRREMTEGEDIEGQAQGLTHYTLQRGRWNIYPAANVKCDVKEQYLVCFSLLLFFCVCVSCIILAVTCKE